MNNTIALNLIETFDIPQDLRNLDPFIPYSREYATDPIFSLSSAHRFNASLLWVLAAQSQNHGSLLASYRNLAAFLEQVAILGFDLWARQETLDRLPEDLAVSAALCAIEHKDLELAISLLDKCRGLTWRQLLRTLPPDDLINGLVDKHPELGVPLRGYLRGLHISSLTNRAKSKRAQKDTQHEIDDHVFMAKEVADLVAQVREIPGYEGFMAPDPIKNIRELANRATVVVLVPGKKCTHVIMLHNSDGGFEHRVVDGLTSDSARRMVERMKLLIRRGGRSVQSYEEPPQGEEEDENTYAVLTNHKDSLERHVYVGSRIATPRDTQEQLNHILLTLWKTVGLTIKDMIYSKDETSPPKIYLYPSGSLTQLPIHAAGEYILPEGESLLDYFTPSYITSFQNLIFPSIMTEPIKLRVFAVSQPNTPGHNPLPAAELEMNIIRKHVPLEQLILAEREEGNVRNFASGIWIHSQDQPLILHCACHARQDPYDPLYSAFYLHDGEIKLSQLLGQRNRYPFLAVLSACETATGNDMRPDEALHIGAAFNCLQGFQSVVATLWAMNDADGPILADVLYSKLFPTDKSNKMEPAAALRLAINKMRDGGTPLIRWVPFVHFGF